MSNPSVLYMSTTARLQAVHCEKAGPVGRNWLNPNREPRTEWGMGPRTESHGSAPGDW